MVSRTIGGQRSNALSRIIVLIALVLASAVLLPVALIAGGLYMLIDVLKRLVLNQGASGNGVIMGGLKGIFRWYLGLVKYVFVGADWPGLVPSRQ